MEKHYECRQCKKMTYGMPNLNDWLCLQCRSLQLSMVYEEKRLQTLTKKELTVEVKKLRENCNKIFDEEENESDLSDHIFSDSNKEDDYVPQSPKKNVKRRIFTPTADKLKRSTSKRKDTDKDADKQKDSSSKEKDTDKDADKQKDSSSKEKDTGKYAEKGEESNTEEYSDGNIEKDFNRSSKGLLKGSSEESESSHKRSNKKASKKCRVRYNFWKNYKGPRCFFQGTGYMYKLKNVQDEEARSYLLLILKKKKQAIREELNKLFRGKSFDFSGSKKKIPCILDKDCDFVGNKLSRPPQIKGSQHCQQPNKVSRKFCNTFGKLYNTCHQIGK